MNTPDLLHGNRHVCVTPWPDAMARDDSTGEEVSSMKQQMATQPVHAIKHPSHTHFQHLAIHSVGNGAGAAHVQ